MSGLAGRQPPSLTVAVATYRRPEGLRRLLAALRPQVAGIAGREIVVVNDGSHDDAYEMVRRAFGDIAAYQAAAQNRGIAETRNALAAMGTGAFLVYVDDDCEPPPWWLDWLAARLAAAPELDVVAGPTRPLWPEGKRRFIARVQAHYGLLPRPRQSHDAILFVTANVAIRRSALLAAGGFGYPGFTGASEDSELASRLALRGALMRIDQDWHVFHEVTGNLAELCRRYWRYGFANGSYLRLASAPRIYDELLHYRRRDHLQALKARHTAQRSLRETFSPRRMVQRLSGMAAAVVSLAYLEGCAAGVRARKGAPLRR